MKRIVIALGGNALIRRAQKGTAEEQLANLAEPMSQIAALAAQGYRIAITHGNGPQVGYLLLQQETPGKSPKMPLDVCVAETQGQIGFLVEIALENAFRAIGMDKLIATIVTGVVVDAGDPAFQKPTKPIGPYYTDEQAKLLPYKMKKIPKKGWRRVVSSPRPLRIIQRVEIRKLLDLGIIVVACGGGGIPLVEKDNQLHGVEAVIDKDCATSCLAEQIKADAAYFLTDVDAVYLNFNKPDQKKLGKMTVAEAKKHLEQGQFPPGSMGPKVQAAISFIEAGGREAVITSLDNLTKAVEGKAGTRITA